MTQITVETLLSLIGEKYFCVYRNLEQHCCLKFTSEGRTFLGEGTLMSKGLKEASFLGATFLLGLAALETLLHIAGF